MWILATAFWPRDAHSIQKCCLAGCHGFNLFMIDPQVRSIICTFSALLFACCAHMVNPALKGSQGGPFPETNLHAEL